MPGQQAVLATARRAYALALRGRYGRTGMPWRVHGETIRIDPRLRHLIPHDGEPALYRFIASHVRAGDIVVDLGAFLGVYAVLEARRAGPAGSVITVEPTSWSASMARRHLDFNRAGAAPITLVEAAAGAAPGLATLHEYDLPYVNALAEAVDVTTPPRRRTVPVITVDQLCAEHGIVPTFIRMDVQGAEFDVLRGAREIIGRAGPALTIVAEMHPQCWPSFGMDEAKALAIVADLGLSVEPLVPGQPVFARDAHAIFRPVTR